MNTLQTIGLRVNVFEPGTTRNPQELSSRADQYSHSISNKCGFESMSISFAATLAEAMEWFTNGLGRTCEVSERHARVVWEGLLETIEAQIGQERRSISIRDMANRIRVQYQTVLGTQGTRPSTTTFFEDAESIARYGKKDLMLALGNTSDGSEVDDYGAVMLRKYRFPLAIPSTSVNSGDMGDVRLTLTFAGWYTTLDWLIASNTSTTKTQTTTQIGTLLTAAAAINPFVSTDTSHIVASGVNATEYIEPGTTYRAKIEELLRRGNGVEPYAWGVYEDRVFHARPWAGANPNATTYQRHIGESIVRNAIGTAIEPWLVRPDAMYQTIELLDPAPVSGQQDAAARFYVARTSCSISGGQIALTLEPEQSSDLSALLITRYA
jgi:hypothetical protein